MNINKKPNKPKEVNENKSKSIKIDWTHWNSVEEIIYHEQQIHRALKQSEVIKNNHWRKKYARTLCKSWRLQNSIDSNRRPQPQQSDMGFLLEFENHIQCPRERERESGREAFPTTLSRLAERLTPEREVFHSFSWPFLSLRSSVLQDSPSSALQDSPSSL